MSLEQSIEVPDSYDWREKYPQCVQPAYSIGKGNCSSSYAFSTLSAVSDRICMGTNKTVSLSAQEIIDCDSANYNCEGGYVNKVLNWGKKKGFVTEDCMEYQEKHNECEVDHLESNPCRVDNHIYKIQDYCIAYQDENIKRELVKNGPVLA